MSYPIYYAPAPDEASRRAGAHGKSLTGTRGVYKRGNRYVARFARNGIEHHKQYFDSIAAALTWIRATKSLLPPQGAVPASLHIAR